MFPHAPPPARVETCGLSPYHGGVSLHGVLRLGVLLLALAASGATIKLYLTDGTYHLVREYKVQEDRVRYYSIERGDWEELPLSLVDLKRTEEEMRQWEAKLEEEAKVVSAEDRAEREQREEAARVPVEPGVYLIEGKELRQMPQAESKVVTSKKRSVLKVITPVPVVSGKATVELDGARSKQAIETDRPEFYIRLVAEERFGLVRLKPKSESRVVETWSIVPVTNEILDERDEVEILRQQVGEGLYKIWPKAPLKPGEYAVVEFTEGKGNVQVWDFSFGRQ